MTGAAPQVQDSGMDLHPDCTPFAFLLGTWRGSGEGDYPTIEPFEYFEEITFGHVGKPFFAYQQKTRDAGDGRPLHAEAGYLRGLGGGRVEFVVAQPSGIIEIHAGTIDDSTIQLELTHVHGSPAAKSVTDVVRSLTVESRDRITYRLDMAVVGQPLSFHLRASLDRVDDEPRG